MLLQFFVRIGWLDHNGFERVLKDQGVMNVGGGHHHRDPPAVRFGQNTAFCARYCVIGGRA